MSTNKQMKGLFSTVAFRAGSRGVAVLALMLVLVACDSIEIPFFSDRSTDQESLKWDANVFALFAHLPDANGLRKLSALDHGRGEMVTFQQTAPRKLKAGEPQAMGFHPGVLIQWEDGNPIVVFGGEGDGVVKGLKFNDEGGIEVLSEFKEYAPRYVARFEWPTWGPSLVISPYINGYVVLLKGYDPLSGAVKERVVVPLAGTDHPIQAAERVTVGDVDGDGIEELILVSSVTGEVMQIKFPGEGAGVIPKISLLFQGDFPGMPNEALLFDLDEDGDNDILLPDEAKPGKLNLLINDGQGRFKNEAALDYPGGEGILEARIGRDKDGLVYVLAVGFQKIVLYQKPVGWAVGDQMPMKMISWKQNISNDILLKDMDGDGWLDGVVAGFVGKRNIWVVYGPLWDRFNNLSEKKVVID